MTASDAIEISGDTPMALYRFYDNRDVLLYVGITHTLSGRWARHAEEKPWWSAVARKTVEWHSDRLAAEAAENAAILSECPLHNIRRPRSGTGKGRDYHRYPPLQFRPPEEIRSRLLALAEQTGRPVNAILTEALRAHLAAQPVTPSPAAS